MGCRGRGRTRIMGREERWPQPQRAERRPAEGMEGDREWDRKTGIGWRRVGRSKWMMMMGSLRLTLCLSVGW